MNAQNTFEELLSFIRDNAVAGGLFALLWKTIDKIGAHFAEKRKSEMKDLIKEEVHPHIERLSSNIEKLQDAIVELKNKI